MWNLKRNDTNELRKGLMHLENKPKVTRGEEWGEEIGLRQEKLQRELTPELWFWNDLVRGS